MHWWAKNSPALTGAGRVERKPKLKIEGGEQKTKQDSSVRWANILTAASIEDVDNGLHIFQLFLPIIQLFWVIQTWLKMEAFVFFWMETECTSWKMSFSSLV